MHRIRMTPVSLGSRPIAKLGTSKPAGVPRPRASGPPRIFGCFRALATGSALLAATSWSCSRSSDLPAPPSDPLAAFAGAAGLREGGAAGTDADTGRGLTESTGGAAGANASMAAGVLNEPGSAGGTETRVTGASASGSPGAAGGTDGVGSSLSDDPFEPDSAPCPRYEVELERKPKLVVFVLDTSASMDEPAASTGNRTKWDTVAAVLRAIFETRDPALAVGLVFLPARTNSDSEPSGCIPCESNVPVAPLSSPEHVALLQAGLTARSASPGSSARTTPDGWRHGMRMVGQAIFDPPAGYQDASAMVVLITDGMPTHSLDCSATLAVDAESYAAIDGAEWDDFIAEVRDTTTRTGVPTEVIGLPGSERADSVPLVDGEPEYSPRAKLSALASVARAVSEEDPAFSFGCPFSLTATQPACQNDLTDSSDTSAGGASSADASLACPFGTGTTAQALCQTDLVDSVDLEAALAKAVRDETRCLYRVPTEQRIQKELGANVFPNYDAVIIEYYPDGGSLPVTLVRGPAENESGFGSFEWDWKYVGDLEAIELQASTCQTVLRDPEARLVLDLGCPMYQ